VVLDDDVIVTARQRRSDTSRLKRRLSERPWPLQLHGRIRPPNLPVALRYHLGEQRPEGLVPLHDGPDLVQGLLGVLDRLHDDDDADVRVLDGPPQRVGHACQRRLQEASREFDELPLPRLHQELADRTMNLRHHVVKPEDRPAKHVQVPLGFFPELLQSTVQSLKTPVNERTGGLTTTGSLESVSPDYSLKSLVARNV